MEDDIEIRFARARLRGHQERREATMKWRAMVTEERDRRAADHTIAYLTQQIDRLVAWLAAKEAA